MEKKEYKSAFISGIIKENPLFVSLLGFCPALAVTKSLEAAFGMGVLFTFVLFFSNLLISLLRKLIPEEIKIPCYIIIIASFVTIVKLLCEAYLPELYSTLGVFISLIVVNCIVLGRAEAFSSKNGPVLSILDALGNGLGYTLAICLIALIREILGTGMLTFGTTFTFIANANGGVPFRLYLLKGENYGFAFSFFSNPSGAFLVVSILLAILTSLRNKKENKKKVDAKLAKMKGDNK